MTNENNKQKFEVMMLQHTPMIKDVYGKARTFIDDFMFNLEGKPVYESMGVQPHKTFMLHGQKGTGKSMSIKALNNDINNKVWEQLELKGAENIGLGELNLLVFPYDIGRYGTAYINMSSKIIQDFFNCAGTYAACGVPTMVVMDEADAVLRSRKSKVQSHSEDHKTLETIMKNLQTAHDTPNMYVVLMTNYEEGCDDASLRAGRIDKKYKFNLPDDTERRDAFKNKIKQMRETAGFNNIRRVNYDNLVELSEGFNYADIMSSVDNAIRTKCTDLIKSSDDVTVSSVYVTGSGLETSVKEHAENYVKSGSNKIGFKTG